MEKAVSSGEHAHQLAVRVRQLLTLEQLFREVRAARLSPSHIFKDAKDAEWSETLMLMLVLSMLYSVFDSQSNAVNLKALDVSNEEFREEVSRIIEQWAAIAGPVRRIRHNFAFHLSMKKDGTANALKAVQELGQEGVRKAYELIEELRQVYPWLVLEARGSYRVPESCVPQFREVLAARRVTHQAILNARKQWNDAAADEALDRRCACAGCRSLSSNPWLKRARELPYSMGLVDDR